MNLETLSSLPFFTSGEITVAIFVSVLGLMSYLIYKFGITEKSFEQVIEEQRRHTIEEELKQKSEKVKKEKKFKKTWGKKIKEKSEPEISVDPTPVVETKDVATDIEIIEPKEIKHMKQSKKSKISSGEASPVQEKAKKQNASQVQEKTKKQEVPLVPDKSKKQEASPLQDKIKKTEVTPAEKKEQEKVETEKVKVEQKVGAKEATPPLVAVQNSVSTIQATSQPLATAQKKKKKDQVEKDTSVPLTTSKLLSYIKQTDLEADEIQNLIDALLNKQKDTSSWQKVNDPIAVTKKNLQEKTQLLDLEQQQKEVLTTKLKDVREECNAVKSKMSALEKANQEKISRQQQEIQNLNTRVKQVQDLLLAEKEKSSKASKDFEMQLQASLKSLEEEKAKLLQKISKLESESQSADYDALKKSREDLQKVHALVVEQHTQLVATHKSDLKNLQLQLSDAKDQLEKLNVQNVTLSKDIQALKDSKSASELAKKNIEDKLKAEEKRSAELDAQIKQLTTKSTEIAQLQAELKELRLENERLADQLVTTKERVAGDGQEIIHQNGELNGKSQVTEKSFDDKDKLLEEKETLLAQLNDDLNKQKAKIAVLNEEIEVQKQKNNELREKNWTAMEALSNAEKSAEQRIKEIQSTADQKLALAHLEKDLAHKKVTSTDSDSLEITNKLKEAENKAALRLSDYDREVEKNTQLSSELSRVNELQKSSQQRIAEMEKTVQELKSDLCSSQSRTKECLQRICPSISIDSSLPFEKWLSEFQQQASLAMQSATSQSSHSQVNIEELLKEKEEEFLQKQQQYEQVLAETESTLLKLQESAESQEGLWQERLQSKEQELQQVLSERDSLAAEKEAMQSTFQQISQLEELQEKLKLLQNTIETAETERSHLEQKYDEVNNNCLNLRNQLADKEKQIAELQKESSGSESLNKEIEDLKCKLEKEKKISKDFSSQMIRLNSLVKIGQDALKAEQEMVASLKSQLETAKVSTANGTTSATKASPVINNESQPKTKQSVKSKKRMDASDNK